METISRDARDERHVGVDTCTVDGTTQTGRLATGSLDISGVEIGAFKVTDVPPEEGNSIYLNPEEDGIGPDDAPEVALEEIDEEENVPSMIGQLGRPQTAAAAIKAMEKRQDDKLAQDLGSLGILGNEKNKIKVRGKDSARSKKKQPKSEKKKKKKKDRCLIEDGIRRMCAGRPNAAPPYEQTMLQEAPDEPRSLPLDNTNRSTVGNNYMEQTVTSGLETRTQDGETTSPAPGAADRTANISGEGVDESDDWNLQYDRTAPFVEEDSDDEEPYVRTNAIQVVTTRSLLARREVEEAGAELATSRIGLQVNAPVDSYHRHPQILDVEAGSGDRQGIFSMDEDELEPSSSFGILSNTTFDPALAYYPRPYDHGLNIQQDDLVGEDNSPVDLAMEDAGMEAERAIASVTTTKSPQSFSWIPPFASGAFQAIFLGVSSAQTAALVNGSTHVMEPPMLSNPYVMDMAISEGVRVQHAVPPQDTAWPSAPTGTQPLPLVEVEMFKEPEYLIPRLSTTPLSSTFVSQVTSHSTLPSISSPASRAGPVPVSLSTCGSMESHECEVKGLNREVDPRPAVVASVQHKALPPRSLGLHKVINLDTGASQSLRPATNNEVPLPLSFGPSAIGTTVIDSPSSTSSTPIERNENDVEYKGRAKNGHSEGVYEMVDAVLAITQRGTEKSPPPTDSVTQDKPLPPIPPRIVGSKRKFVEDRSTYSSSINPARKKAKLPRSKRQKIEHENYSTHKRLGEVKNMHH